MKLNGALKPRQGASRQGSSPGVVLKKYRVRRYFKVNKNVANNVPLNERGVQYKNLTKNNIINCVCINNQQQRPATPFSPQLQLARVCGKTFCSGGGLSRTYFSTSLKANKKQIYLTVTTTKQETTQIRISAIRKTGVCRIKNRIQPAAAATALLASAEEVVKVEDIKKETGITIGFKQRKAAKAIALQMTAAVAAGIDNTTTRQMNNTKFNEERRLIKANSIKSEGRKTKQVKYNFTTNKSHNNKTQNAPKEANKFLFIPRIIEILISRLFIQLKLLLFPMFSHAIKYLSKNPFTYCVGCIGGGAGRGVEGCYHINYAHVTYNLMEMMRATQLLKRICSQNVRGLKPSIALYMVIYAATAILLPQQVIADDGDTFYPINGLEATTPEFDYASRGQKKFGDKCENTLECGFPGSICDPKKKSCQCTEDLPVTNHIDKCGKEAAVNESCFFNEQCEVKYFQTECRDQRCVCRFDMTPVWLKDGSVECKGRGDKKGPETYIDPAMIGVLIGMALMFIIICVVLRLFSQARWRENRTIFNTPNPRLMNVSLLRESKLLHGQERRGSRMSVRAPSRQPSMASLRPHSPNPSLGKTGRMTRSRSNTRSSDSRVSDASNCSRLLEHHTHHAFHTHSNAISPHPPRGSTCHGPETSLSPTSLTAPTINMENVTQTENGSEATDCSTNATNLPPKITNKPTKF